MQTEDKCPTQVTDEGNASKPLSTLPGELQKISVIIPTLNESGNIADLLVRLDQAMTQAGIFYEAIVVDDRSTDNTLEVAASIARDKCLPVCVLTKQGQTGKSFSLMEGFAAAQCDVLAMIDADLQYPPEVLPAMVQRLAHADIVVGDRRSSYRDASRSRGTLSGVFTFVVDVLFGVDTDMQSGLKVFRRHVYERAAPDPGKWSFDLHLVTKAVNLGYAVANIPIMFEQRQSGTSKVGPLAVGSELMMAALRLKLSLTASSVMGVSLRERQRPWNTPFLQSNAAPETPRVDTTSVEQAIHNGTWFPADAWNMVSHREETNGFIDDALQTAILTKEELAFATVQTVQLPAFKSVKYLSQRRLRRNSLIPISSIKSRSKEAI